LVWGCSPCVSAPRNWAAPVSWRVLLGLERASALGYLSERRYAMEPLRVLIADDHPLFRHGIQALLSATVDLVVVGEASTGEEAVSLAATLAPDVLLMDIQMPGVNGIEATRQILRERPHARILMVTMFEDDASVFTAMRAGARGYVLKDTEK